MHLHDRFLQSSSFELPVTLCPPLKLSDFKKTIGAKQTRLFFLENRNGMKCALTTYGARVVSLSVPIDNGKNIEMVAGFKTLDAYFKSSDIYDGAVVGRFCNRIEGANLALKAKISYYKELTGNYGVIDHVIPKTQ